MFRLFLVNADVVENLPIGDAVIEENIDVINDNGS
jgi:hypothetical protein